MLNPDSDLGPDFVDWTYRSPAVRVTLKPDVIIERYYNFGGEAIGVVKDRRDRFRVVSPAFRDPADADRAARVDGHVVVLVAAASDRNPEQTGARVDVIAGREDQANAVAVDGLAKGLALRSIHGRISSCSLDYNTTSLAGPSPPTPGGTPKKTAPPVAEGLEDIGGEQVDLAHASLPGIARPTATQSTKVRLMNSINGSASRSFA